MTKFVIGIILLSIFLLVAIGSVLGIILSSPNPAQLQALLKGWFLGLLGWFIIFGLPGILLAFYGNRSIKSQRSVLSNAIQMLHKEKEIDISVLSENSGLSDEETKKILANLQRKGQIPNEVQI